MKKKFLSILLAAVMLLTLLPVTALAAGDTVSYVDENGEAKSATAVTLTSGSTTWSGWVYVDSSLEITGPVTLSADTHLILKDNVTLTVNGGITDNGNGFTLTVYGQTGQSGTLTVTGGNGENNYSGNGGNGGAGITGNMTVNGGTVEVTGGTGGNGSNSLTSNGGNGGNGGIAVDGNVTVNKGTVNVTGGNGGNGGTSRDAISGNGGNGGNGVRGDVVVNDGKLTATGGSKGSGGETSGSDKAAFFAAPTINAESRTVLAGADNGSAELWDNATVLSTYMYVSIVSHDLKVTKANGSDVTEGTADDYVCKDYYWDGDVLHILGPGLIVTGLRETGETIYVEAEDVTLDGVEINTASSNVPLYLSGMECTVTLVHTNTLKTNHNSAVYGFDILITGNGRLDAIADTDMNNRYGIYAYNSLTVNSGTVNAAAGDATGSGHDSIGIYVEGKFILGSGTVTAKAGTATQNSYGISASSIKVVSGTLTAQGKKQAVTEVPTGNINTVTASENYDGTSPVGEYKADVIATYKYIRLEAAHALKVTKNGGTAAEGSDYEWNGKTLIIKQNGLTVSGTTTTESIGVDSSASNLTLSGVNITGSDRESLIYAESDLKITLVGENTLTQGYGDPAIYVENCALEITGKGNLAVESGFHGIYGDTDYEKTSWKSSSLTISASGDVRINTTGSDPNLPAAINMDGDITISGSGNVTATSIVGPAIMSEYFNITISGSGSVTAQSSSEYAAIYAVGNMTLNTSGTINAENTEGGSAIGCDGTLSIGANTGKIIAHGYCEGEYGAIEVYNDTVEIANGVQILGAKAIDAVEDEVTAEATLEEVGGSAYGSYSYMVNGELAQTVVIKGQPSSYPTSVIDMLAGAIVTVITASAIARGVASVVIPVAIGLGGLGFVARVVRTVSRFVFFPRFF